MRARIRHPAVCFVVGTVAVADAIYHLAVREPLRVSLGIKPRAT